MDFSGVSAHSHHTGPKPTRRKLSIVSIRNLQGLAPSVFDKYITDDIELPPEFDVELRDGRFMRIKYIIQDTETMEVKFRGWLFRRNSSMDGELEQKQNLNEICWILHVEINDDRDFKDQGMETISSCDILKQRKVKLTNWPYSHLNCRHHSTQGNQRTLRDEGVLYCRWKYIWYYPDATARNKNEFCEKALLSLRANEGDGGTANRDDPCPIEDDDVRRIWRGETVRGGESPGRNTSTSGIFTRSMAPQRRYTFGDCFCGAGGTSRGALMAGLCVEWGFDSDEPACESYRLNFDQAKVYQIEADEFSNWTGVEHKVDIVHLSPPCQPFSRAHTVEGRNDERNIASLFAVPMLLDRAKPRVVLLEQTDGILHHKKIFYSLLKMFTSKGFSIRWRVLNFANFGLAQIRKRFIIIASCPGETLPSFPQPTHGGFATPQPTHSRFATPQAALKPYTTVNQVIDGIPYGWDLHNLDTLQPITLEQQENRRCYSGDAQCPTFTTINTNIFHPSGKRRLTLREVACLQGFPLEHRFGRKGVRKQIGNAVPPIVGMVLLEELKKALMKADGLP